MIVALLLACTPPRAVLREDDVASEYWKSAEEHDHVGTRVRLEQILLTTPEGPKQAEILLRLAEVALGDARLEHDLSERNRLLTESATASRRFLDWYPHHADRERGLYHQADALAALGDAEGARVAWTELAQGWRAGRFACIAYVRIGASYEDLDGYPAMTAFHHASTYDDPAAAYAAWRYAWLLWSFLGEPQDAIPAMERAVAIGEARGATQVLEIARADLARFRAEPTWRPLERGEIAVP